MQSLGRSPVSHRKTFLTDSAQYFRLVTAHRRRASANLKLINYIHE